VAKYRKIDTRIWNDNEFLDLSVEAKIVYLFLLTHQNLTPFGAIKISKNAICDELRNGFERVSKGFDELLEKEFFRVDDRLLVWFPNFLKYNNPENPNVLKSWAGYLDYLPQCDLKDDMIQHLIDFVNGLGKGFERVKQTVTETLSNTKNKEQRTKNKEQINKNTCQIASAIVTHVSEKDFQHKNEVIEIFEFWKLKIGKTNRVVLDERRRRLISSSLKKYGIDDCKNAIIGCGENQYNIENNHTSIDLIFRNSEKTERFIDLSKNIQSSELSFNECIDLMQEGIENEQG